MSFWTRLATGRMDILSTSLISAGLSYGSDVLYIKVMPEQCISQTVLIRLKLAYIYNSGTSL